MKLKEVKNRIQNLPEKKRKTILWLIVAVIGIVLLFFWLRSFQDRLQNLKGENIMDKIKLEGI